MSRRRRLRWSGSACRAAWICPPALPARVLSFGQRRRVALAGLMTAGALLWILDEPLTGLDVEGVALVERMIRDHVVAGGLAVMTTHQPMSLDGLTPQTLSVGT